MYCFHLAQNRHKRRVPVNTVMNLRVPKQAANFLTSVEIASFLRGSWCLITRV
jgi:hypothetical protein